MTDHRPDGATATATVPPVHTRPSAIPAPAPTPPPPSPAPTGDGGHEHRRLLVGDLVVRRVSYRSVSRVAWPFFFALYACTLAAGAVAWNVAALTGWSPADDDLVGSEVFWSAVGAGVLLIPLAVTIALGIAALYNVISERAGGLEVKVVSPRRSRRRDVDR